MQFVISISELEAELAGWSSCFFFYQGGLIDAIKTILSTFEYPTQREHGYNSHGVNPILHDFDMTLEALERDNAVPPGAENMWDALELAIHEVDAAIYAELKRYLGDIEAKTVDATFINARNDCLIVVEY